VNKDDFESVMVSNEPGTLKNSEALLTIDEALSRVGASHYYQKRAFVYFGLQWAFAK